MMKAGIYASVSTHDPALAVALALWRGAHGQVRVTDEERSIFAARANYWGL